MDLDSVQIGVGDFASAVRDYEVLLGMRAVRPGAMLARFALERGAVELQPGEPGVHALRFSATSPDEASTWSNQAAAFNGLDVRVMKVRQPDAPFHYAPDGVCAIDHVVIQSPDLDRAVALWRDQLGVRLALDREFPARGLRMLFFRSAGVTLEFVGSLSPPAQADGPDCYYGLAYTVRDLQACHTRLRAAGVDVSEVREGQKRGTIVVTVRSSTAGVPTLLVQTIA